MNNGWISFEERKPEELEYILICIAHKIDSGKGKDPDKKYFLWYSTGSWEDGKLKVHATYKRFDDFELPIYWKSIEDILHPRIDLYKYLSDQTL